MLEPKQKDELTFVVDAHTPRFIRINNTGDRDWRIARKTRLGQIVEPGEVTDYRQVSWAMALAIVAASDEDVETIEALLAQADSVEDGERDEPSPDTDATSLPPVSTLESRSGFISKPPDKPELTTIHGATISAEDPVFAARLREIHERHDIW